MKPRDMVINGTSYRWANNSEEYPFIGPDGVRYKKHSNGGGFVAETASVDPGVHVGPCARVFGTARLSGKVWVTGLAQVGGTVIATAGVFAQEAYVIEGEYHQSIRIIVQQQKQ